jgi:hypothetical protein
MRKLVESTFVTLDGVISSPHVWGSPYWNEEHDAYAHDLLFAADELLLGRVAGDGDRLLDGIDITHLRLIGTKPFSTGIVVLTYAPK